MSAQYPDDLEAELPVKEDHQTEILHRAEDHQKADIPQEEAPTPVADMEPAITIFLQMNRHPIYDIYIDKKTGELYIFLKGGKGEGFLQENSEIKYE